MSIFGELKQKAEDTQKTSFKTKRRHFKKSMSRTTKSITIDDFGNPYRATHEEDKVIIVSLTLPQSLVNVVDKQRGKIARSRYFREMIEYCMDLENADNIEVDKNDSDDLEMDMLRLSLWKLAAC